MNIRKYSFFCKLDGLADCRPVFNFEDRNFHMISPDERKFMEYWETNRKKEKKTLRQFLLGIPAGLLLVIPIIINISSGWYKRAGMIMNSGEINPGVLIIAMLIIIGFVAIFSRRHRWDINEQKYKELKARDLDEWVEKEKN